MTAVPPIDAPRVVSNLRELARRTGGRRGARRLCWGPEWRRAREHLCELLAELAIEPETDAAGNLWATLPGLDGNAPALALGSHLDSVPAGGWLDGALGVHAALGVLRTWHTSGRTPPRSLVLIDFADEEGARFGRSLYGSSALAGTLVPEDIAGLLDHDDRRAEDVLADDGVVLANAPAAHVGLERIGAYLELHIEQGPVLDREDEPVAAVAGCVGVERHRCTFRGQASHAGTTPMGLRRDAVLAAADTALHLERIAVARGGVATTGQWHVEPGVPTAVPGVAALVVDLRHKRDDGLAAMLAEAQDEASHAAAMRNCEVIWEPVWSIAPTPFDPGLLRAARGACRRLGGREGALTSGALHDAAELARVVPTVMLFTSSVDGISHAKEEDTRESHLLTAVTAFGDLAGEALEHLAAATSHGHPREGASPRARGNRHADRA